MEAHFFFTGTIDWLGKARAIIIKIKIFGFV